MWRKKVFIDLILNSLFLTGYVTNSNTFPMPLDEEEEQMYLKKFKEGDKAAKSILIERNLRLVAHIVKKYSFPNKDVDELISIGTVGLIKAIDSFDSSKGTRLATYASRCIENEILMLFRNNKKQKSEVYLQDPVGVDKEGNEFCLLDILSSEKDCVLESIIKSSAITPTIHKIITNIEKIIKNFFLFIYFPSNYKVLNKLFQLF